MVEDSTTEASYGAATEIPVSRFSG